LTCHEKLWVLLEHEVLYGAWSFVEYFFKLVATTYKNAHIFFFPYLIKIQGTSFVSLGHFFP